MRQINGVDVKHVAIIGGMVCNRFLGGYDKLLQALFVMMIIDFATGLLKAWYNHEVNSKISAKGIIKKVSIICVVIVANEIQVMSSASFAIRDMVVMFYLVNEGISLIENVSEFLPVPDKLKEVFTQLNEKDGNKK